jgi:hypothetical protein
MKEFNNRYWYRYLIFWFQFPDMQVPQSPFPIPNNRETSHPPLFYSGNLRIIYTLSVSLPTLSRAERQFMYLYYNDGL